MGDDLPQGEKQYLEDLTMIWNKLCATFSWWENNTTERVHVEQLLKKTGKITVDDLVGSYVKTLDDARAFLRQFATIYGYSFEHDTIFTIPPNQSPRSAKPGANVIKDNPAPSERPPLATLLLSELNNANSWAICAKDYRHDHTKSEVLAAFEELVHNDGSFVTLLDEEVLVNIVALKQWIKATISPAIDDWIKQSVGTGQSAGGSRNKVINVIDAGIKPCLADHQIQPGVTYENDLENIVNAYQRLGGANG